jgi:hypothetical protein
VVSQPETVSIFFEIFIFYALMISICKVQAIGLPSVSCCWITSGPVDQCSHNTFVLRMFKNISSSSEDRV